MEIMAMCQVRISKLIMDIKEYAAAIKFTENTAELDKQLARLDSMVWNARLEIDAEWRRLRARAISLYQNNGEKK